LVKGSHEAPGGPPPKPSGRKFDELLARVGKRRLLLIVLAGVVLLLGLSLSLNFMLAAKLQEYHSRKQKLEQQMKTLGR